MSGVCVSSALQFIADITLSCRHSWTPRHVWPCVIMAECVFLPFDSIVPGFFVVNRPPSNSECVCLLCLRSLRTVIVSASHSPLFIPLNVQRFHPAHSSRQNQVVALALGCLHPYLLLKSNRHMVYTQVNTASPPDVSGDEDRDVFVVAAFK